jgi:hypothetical protein
MEYFMQLAKQRITRKGLREKDIISFDKPTMAEPRVS